MFSLIYAQEQGSPPCLLPSQRPSLSLGKSVIAQSFANVYRSLFSWKQIATLMAFDPRFDRRQNRSVLDQPLNGWFRRFGHRIVRLGTAQIFWRGGTVRTGHTRARLKCDVCAIIG